MKLSSVFKLLKGPIQVERVRCATTGMVVEGQFDVPLFLSLPPDQMAIVESLVVHGGNLKSVAEDIGISYPTLKQRLEEISAKFKRDAEARVLQRMALLDRVERGEITADEAAEQNTIIKEIASLQDIRPVFFSEPMHGHQTRVIRDLTTAHCGGMP